MKISVLTRILSIMAMIGLLSAPMMTPSVAEAAVVVATSGIVADNADVPEMPEMPEMALMSGRPDCCPPPKSPVRDCGRTCPWAALCTAQCLPNAAATGVPIGPLAEIQVAQHSLDDRNRDRVRDPPPRRPPRT